jgi:cytochrome c553
MTGSATSGLLASFQAVAIKTSRSQISRRLDLNDGNITLETLQCAAKGPAREVRLGAGLEQRNIGQAAMGCTRVFHGEAASGQCSVCHGVDGKGTSLGFGGPPALCGHVERMRYLQAQRTMCAGLGRRRFL